MLKWFYQLGIVVVCVLLASCYQEDAEESPYAGMADRKEAQAYIVSSYNKLNTQFHREDFKALSSVIQSMDAYDWADKEFSIAQAKKYAKSLLNGDVSVLRELMEAAERNAGIYKADANKVFHKVSDARQELELVFNQDVTVGLGWSTAWQTQSDGKPDHMVLNLSLGYNDYSMTGYTEVYSDSIYSSYLMTRNGTTLLRLARTTLGKGFLAAVTGQSGEDFQMRSTDLKVQLIDMLCFHDTQNDVSSIVSYVKENANLQLSDPKKFLEGWTKLSDSLSRMVLTKPNGTLLCKVTEEVQPLDDTYTISPYFHWSDDTSQSLSEFASDTANENFATDALLLHKLWQSLYQLVKE